MQSIADSTDALSSQRTILPRNRNHGCDRRCLPSRQAGSHIRLSISIVAVAVLAACGQPHNRPPGGTNAAVAVRAFPAFPGSTWDGDITSEEADGQIIWLISWTAPSPESDVRDFFMRTVGQFGWKLGAGRSEHELWLDREDPTLRGYIRFGAQGVDKAGTSVTLGIRDPRRRENGCLRALPWLPRYPGAVVRSCDLVHIPGARSLSVLAATGDDVAVADQTLSRAFLVGGWTSRPAVIGGQVFREHSGDRATARVIWGADPTGHLQTGFMISVDLPETSLRELPQ